MREKARSFWYDISQKKLTITSAAFILGVTGLASNFLGLVREALIAHNYGNQPFLTDVYFASFRIPDLIFNLLVLGAISSAFIPVFVDYLSDDKKKTDSIGDAGREESNLMASNFLNFLLLGTAVLGVVLFILAPRLVPFLLPGFFAHPQEAGFNVFQTTVNLVRILLLSPIFFALSSVFGGILNSNKRFFTYALAPLVYNLSIIFGITVLSKHTSLPVYGIVYGVVIGVVLHALIQLPEVIMAKFKWRPILNFRAYSLPMIIKLMVPRTIAIGVGQINLLVDTLVASYFIGGITALNFANDIQTLPTVVFAIAIATAVFPFLAELNSKNDRGDFIRVFSESARKILYFMIPATIGILVLRAQIVRLLFGVGGNFSWENTYWTTKALAYFAVGLVAQGLIPLALKAFYALKDTKTPLIIGVIVMAVNAVLSVSLPFIPGLGLGPAGVALAFSVAGFVNVGLLFYYLHEKIGALDRDNKIFSSVTRLLIASVVMGIVAHYSLYFFDAFFDTSRVVGLFAQTTGAVVIGALVYFLLTRLMHVQEAGEIFKKTAA